MTEENQTDEQVSDENAVSETDGAELSDEQLEAAAGGVKAGAFISTTARRREVLTSDNEAYTPKLSRTIAGSQRPHVGDV